VAEPRTITELVAQLKAERPDWNPDTVFLASAAAICEAGVEREREACALLIESRKSGHPDDSGYNEDMDRLARLIRARGRHG
jgi:hypothetical protein